MRKQDYFRKEQIVYGEGTKHRLVIACIHFGEKQVLLLKIWSNGKEQLASLAAVDISN